MRKVLLVSVALFIFTPAWGARSFNGTSNGGEILCTGTAGGCTSVCASCTIAPILTSTASSFTVSFWLWENSWGTSDALVWEQSTNYNNRSGAMVFDSGGTPGSCGSKNPYIAQFVSGTTYRVRSWTAPSAAAWHHYVFSLTNSGTWTVYIDGVSQSLNNCDAGSPGTVNFDQDGLSLMSRNNGGSLWNGGKLSQFAIWQGVALTANEAKSLASCVEPWLIRPESLSAYVPFSGASSPEPSYAISQGLLTESTIVGATQVNDPGVCPGVQP